MGAYLSPNLAQTLENGKNYNHIEKFMIRIPKQGHSQDSDSAVLAESLLVSPKIYFNPYKYRGYGDHWELYMQHEKIYAHGMAKQVTHPFLRIGDQGGMAYPLERLDEIRSKLGQRLANMGQVAPPQSTSRTKTGTTKQKNKTKPRFRKFKH